MLLVGLHRNGLSIFPCTDVKAEWLLQHLLYHYKTSHVIHRLYLCVSYYSHNNRDYVLQQQ
jgi:hypothetical protein